jgi:hypothetical protein
MISVRTAEWHIASQMCEQLITLEHLIEQGGQSDSWHLW